MATNFHPDLPNDQLHVPKDFQPAPNSSVLTKDSTGLLDWNTSPYETTTIVTCAPDVAGGLHNTNFFLFISDAIKYEAHFDVTGETAVFVPTVGFLQLPITIAPNETAISVAAQIKTDFDSLGISALTTTVNGTGKVTFTGMENTENTTDGNTKFFFDNSKNYVDTTVLTSTRGVLSWEIGGGGSGTVTAVTASKPANSTGGTTPEISIDQATVGVDGYLSATDYVRFNNKQNTINLTTTGTSGASTLVGSTLNVPQYSSPAPFSTFEQSFRGWFQAGIGTFIQDSHGTHFDKHTRELRATMTLDFASRGAQYCVNPGDEFVELQGMIEGTTGAQLTLQLYYVRFDCGQTQVINQTIVAQANVVLQGDRVPICYRLLPASPGVFTNTGLLIYAIFNTQRENVTANYNHSLKILRP